MTTLTGTVTDATGVASVTAFLATNVGHAESYSVMATVTGEQWSVQMEVGGGNCQLWVEAVDVLGNVSQTYGRSCGNF